MHRKKKGALHLDSEEKMGKRQKTFKCLTITMTTNSCLMQFFFQSVIKQI